MGKMSHPNIVRLRHVFYTSGEKPDDLFLNLVMTYMPDTLYGAARAFYKQRTSMPPVAVKLYTYQMLRGLAYIHYHHICHRDIKPQNLLVDPSSHKLCICDFGSAKKLVEGQPNIAYICSRYYRAPELIFGATDYTEAVDIWSAGCVFMEIVLGTPLFTGENSVDQLVEIIKVLGSPTAEQLAAMKPQDKEFKFPHIKKVSWNVVVNKKLDSVGCELAAGLLEYSPKGRLQPLQACGHQFFDEIRQKEFPVPNGGEPPPDLFKFTKEELSSVDSEVRSRLIPEAMKKS